MSHNGLTVGSWRIVRETGWWPYVAEKFDLHGWGGPAFPLWSGKKRFRTADEAEFWIEKQRAKRRVDVVASFAPMTPQSQSGAQSVSSPTLVTETMACREALVQLSGLLHERYHGRRWTGTPDSVDYARTASFPFQTAQRIMRLDDIAEKIIAPNIRALAADIVRDLADAPAMIFAHQDGDERYDGICATFRVEGDTAHFHVRYSLAGVL